MLRRDPSAHESLFTRIIQVPEFTWIWRDSPPPGIDLPEGARLHLLHRYRTAPALCTVRRYASPGSHSPPKLTNQNIEVIITESSLNAMNPNTP